MKSVGKMALMSLVGLFIIIDAASADRICQRKNEPPPVYHKKTRVQHLIIELTSCPKGYKDIGELLSASQVKDLAEQAILDNTDLIEDIASGVVTDGLQGPPGPPGPQGPAGPQGAAGTGTSGEPPIVMDISSTEIGGASCVDIDLEDLCGDADGCKIQFLMQNEGSSDDKVKNGEAFVYIGAPQVGSDDDDEGVDSELSGHTHMDPDDKSWKVGGPNPDKTIIFSPFDWASVRNYHPSNCPGGATPPFQGKDVYKFTFISNPGVHTTAIVTDNSF